MTLPEEFKVAINISGLQLRKETFADLIADILAETGLPVGRLELDTAESAHGENHAPLLATMRRLKRVGISLVLHEFGTGPSSINYLAALPFDKVKIDKSLTAGAPVGKADAAVVASTLALARGLGIGTAAIGVETARQFEYLRHAGVDIVQGYLFGQPAPIAELGAQMARTLDALRRLANPTEQPSRRRVSRTKAQA